MCIRDSNHTVAHAPRSCSIQIGGVQSFYKKPAAAGWDWPMECVFRDLKSKASTNAAFVARDVLGTVGQLQHGTVTPGRSARPSAPLVVSPTLSTHAARRGGNALDRETIMTDRRVFIIRAKRVSNCYMREKKNDRLCGCVCVCGCTANLGFSVRSANRIRPKDGIPLPD